MGDQTTADVQKPLEAVTEQARIAALDLYRTLDASVAEGLSRLAAETAASFSASHAAVTFVDASRVWLGGAFGFGVGDIARDESFCDAVVRGVSPLLVPDGQADPRFRQHEMVRGAPGLRSYAGAPLIDQGGYTLGAIAVFSVVPNAFSAAVLQDLAALAVLVRDFLAEARGVVPIAPLVPPAVAGRVQGWLGVKTLSTTEGKAGTLAGLVVLSVARGSPAHKAGIRPTDILHSIGGLDLFVSSDVVTAMAGRAAGSRVPVRFRRSGEWHHRDIEIKARRRRILMGW